MLATGVSYEEPRSVAAWLKECLFLGAGIALPLAVLIARMLDPKLFPLDFPFAIGAVGILLLPAAWFVAFWPSEKAEMLEALPLAVADGTVRVPVHPFLPLRRAAVLRTEELSAVLANVEVGDGLRHLVIIDVRGTRYVRPYKRNDLRAEVYASTVNALARIAPVTDLSRESRRTRAGGESVAIGLGAAVPLVLLAASALLLPLSSVDGYFVGLSSVLLGICFVTMPIFWRTRSRRLRALIRRFGRGRGR